MDGFGNDSFGGQPQNQYLSGYQAQQQNFEGGDNFGFENNTATTQDFQQQQQQQEEFQQDAFQAESLGGQTFENDPLAGQDYYGGGNTETTTTTTRSRVFDDTPKPGHFALDGSYVPPTNFKNESTPELDESNGPYREWQDKYAKELGERDAEELRAKKELDSNAKAELDAYYVAREKSILSNAEKNTNAEQVFIADRDAEVTANNLWDRVTKLVDVSKQPSGTSVDLARFRSLLLQLKHNPV